MHINFFFFFLWIFDRENIVDYFHWKRGNMCSIRVYNFFDLKVKLFSSVQSEEWKVRREKEICNIVIKLFGGVIILRDVEGDVRFDTESFKLVFRFTLSNLLQGKGIAKILIKKLALLFWTIILNCKNSKKYREKISFNSISFLKK